MEGGIQEALRRFGPSWAARCRPTAHQATVLQHIRDCRTEALGGHVTVCPECGEEHVLYHSCRDRHCPRCQFAQREAWLLSRKEELLPVTYFHVVFTLPDALNGIVLGHQEGAYAALFHAAWDTLGAFAGKQGVQLGMTALLHTWGSALVFHPHLHCIVPGGGRAQEGGKWKSLPQVKGGDKEPFLFPVKALGVMFRAKYMAALSAVSDIPDDIRKACFSKPWVVYAKSPVTGPESTLEYLSRYAYRVAIGDRRVLAVGDGGAPGNRAALAALQAELGAAPVPLRRARRRWRDIATARGLVMGLCPYCGVGVLLVVKTLPHIRSPERNPSLYVG